MKITPPSLETQSIHGGTSPDLATGAVKTPIYQTVGYRFKDAQFATDLFNMNVEGYAYTRISNPTTDALEKRVACLEGGVGAVATSSGIAANLLALLPLMEPGCEIVSSNRLYGGTLAQFNHTLKKFGWACHFVDADNPDNFAKATNDRTRAYFCETQSNPLSQICDIETIAQIAHSHGIPLIADNTIPTPYLWRPIEWGADIVLHSTTKFLNGHGNSVGGIVVDSGNFDWAQNNKFPSLTQPEDGQHGLVFVERFKEQAYIAHCRAVGLRDLGCCQSPMDSFLTLEGIETLTIRMERHVKNTLEIAHFLNNHPKVRSVSYPSLDGSRYFKLAQKYMPSGASALFTFDVSGGFDAGLKIAESCKVFTHLISLGETHSLISHPASTTHRPLTEQQLKAAGITAGTVRLAIGLEDPKDLIADLEQALEKI